MTYDSTASESLHLNIEQRLDILMEQETALGSFNRIQVSAWKEFSLSISRVYARERGFTDPLLHNAKS